MTLKVAVNGAAGRMGRLLVSAVLDAHDLELVAATDHPDHPYLHRDLSALLQREPTGLPLKALDSATLERAEVVIDFSLPEGTRRLLELARDLPLVVGTTGLDAETDRLLTTYSRRAPVVSSPNFATGVAVLVEVVAYAAAALPEFDVEIVETHHARKRDAPSGTALRMARAAADAREQSLEKNACFGRRGETGERPRGQIGIHAVRAGDVIGEHDVILAGRGERIRIGHVATSREAFVDGAIRSARWVQSKTAGRYSVLDVLGIRPLDGHAVGK